jgi:drug/metabolite transporter (DMT)-like permease
LHALALGLLLAAACLHVTWNLLIKRAAARDVVTWWAIVAGSVLFLPVLLAAEPLPAAVGRLAVASAAVEAVYYVLLAYAYGQGDFSQVYPIARGAAPVLLAVWSALLLREYPSVWGACGIIGIVLGLVVIGTSAAPGAVPRGERNSSGGSVSPRDRAGVSRRSGILVALGVALFTSVYSLIDGIAVRRAAPAPYQVAVLGLTGLFLAPRALLRFRPGLLLAEFRRQWARIVAAGVLMMLAYTLVLRAYEVERLAYAGAVREVGVVLAALVGWRWLGESFGPRRVAGASAVFLGIMVLALFG